MLDIAINSHDSFLAERRHHAARPSDRIKTA